MTSRRRSVIAIWSFSSKTKKLLLQKRLVSFLTRINVLLLWKIKIFQYTLDCYKVDIHLFVLGKREDTYEDFLQDIFSAGPEDCRYGLYDFEYQHQCEGTNEKSKKEKLLLMSWCPDTAKIKKKMLYSSSFDALKKCLVGVQKYIQVM